MKHVSAQAFKQILNAEKTNPSVEFINVCTSSEYKEKHIPGVKNIPLDELEHRLNELEQKNTIYIHCKSGNRSLKAIEKLTNLGIQAELVNVEGGITAWEKLSFPTNRNGETIPIIRQVFILAGILILTGIALSIFVNSYFILLTVFIACGLIFAGITGWCGMAFLLAKMPWNK